MAKKKLTKLELKLKKLKKQLEWDNARIDHIVQILDELRDEMELLVDESAEIQYEIEELEEFAE